MMRMVDGVFVYVFAGFVIAVVGGVEFGRNPREPRFVPSLLFKWIIVLFEVKYWMHKRGLCCFAQFVCSFYE